MPASPGVEARPSRTRGEELRRPDYPGCKTGRRQALRQQVRVSGAACYAVRQPGAAQARTSVGRRVAKVAAMCSDQLRNRRPQPG